MDSHIITYPPSEKWSDDPRSWFIECMSKQIVFPVLKKRATMGFSLQYTDTVTGQLCEAKNVELKGSIKSCSVV